MPLLWLYLSLRQTIPNSTNAEDLFFWALGALVAVVLGAFVYLRSRLNTLETSKDTLHAERVAELASQITKRDEQCKALTERLDLLAQDSTKAIMAMTFQIAEQDRRLERMEQGLQTLQQLWTNSKPTNSGPTA